MSEHIHLHTAHEHALEHKAKEGGLAQWVAILSALLACFAAVVGYQSSSKENQAILHKNEAIIKTTQAADIWALYQAKKTKAHLMEIAIALSNNSEKVRGFKEELGRYTQEATQLQEQAKKLDVLAQVADDSANEALEPHEKLAQSMILLQIAISLASIAALTRKYWLFIVSIMSASGGFILASYAWLFLLN